MSSSFSGTAPASVLLLTNRSRSGLPIEPAACDGSTLDQGATSASSATFLGPVRRSYRNAICVRQLSAACWRSSAFISNCTSFPASSNAGAETGGPTAGDVPNAGGAPATGSPGPASLREHDAATALINTVDDFRNCLRDFAIGSPHN